jgi:predicted lipid-binding transport protein (Tim44 family)
MLAERSREGRTTNRVPPSLGKQPPLKHAPVKRKTSEPPTPPHQPAPEHHASFSDAASTVGSTAGGALLGTACGGVVGALLGGALGLFAGIITSISEQRQRHRQ